MDNNSFCKYFETALKALGILPLADITERGTLGGALFNRRLLFHSIPAYTILVSLWIKMMEIGNERLDRYH